MMFVLGMVAGAAIALIGFVTFMAPKHWDWYQQNIDLREQLRVAVERAAHYQNLVRPNEWGSREKFDARIVPKAVPPYEGITLQPGESIEFKFDDIRHGGDT